MVAEGKNHDYKSDFDADDPSAKLKLVKHLVAMANSGGGTISLGMSETATRGLDAALSEDLDSSRIADFADKFLSPASLELSHDKAELEDGKMVIHLHVAAATYPMVMSRQGICL